MNSGGEPPPPELEAGTDSEVEVTPTPSEDEAEKAKKAARTDEEKASPDDTFVSTNKRICIADTPHPETEKEKGQGEAGKRFTVSVRGRRNRRLSPSNESLSPLLRNVRSPHHHT